MDEQLARRLQQVGKKYKLNSPFFSYEEIHQGNVNHTYRVDYIRDDGTGMARIKNYLVQRVNTYAFRDPVALMENIDKVTEYIHAKRPKQTCLHYHHTDESKTYLFEGEEFWRVCNYIPSVTYDTCEDLEIVRSAAEAFGDFQIALAEFDASQLSYTIPDFHNTRKRYETLIANAKEDKLGRVRNIREELDYLLSVQDLALFLHWLVIPRTVLSRQRPAGRGRDFRYRSCVRHQRSMKMESPKTNGPDRLPQRQGAA